MFALPTRVFACVLFAFIAQAQPAPAAYLRTPTPRYLAWHELEYYAFVHPGANTFTNEEWGRSQSTPDIFNLTTLDTDQWARTFAMAGMAGMILTAKHHDGMALWDTKTTTYKIGNGRWAQDRISQGLSADVVKLAAASAKKHGIKFGIYLSPWYIHRDPAMPKTNLTGTIYDEPQIFGDDTPGDYNEFYAGQLADLVTMKDSNGTIIDVFEIWIDGNSGSATVQTFNWTHFRDIIRDTQPNAVMWGHQGVDARWVGNEDGFAAAINWHTISRTQDETHYEGDQLETGIRDGLYWTPAEARRKDKRRWFYHANEEPKTVDALMNMYWKRVGQSVNLLLDVPPDVSGKIVERDSNILMNFRKQRDAFLNRTVLVPAMKVNAGNVRGGNRTLYAPSNVLDGDINTYLAMEDALLTGTLEVDLGGTYSINAIILQEHIALGQRIGAYAVDALISGDWLSIVSGTSMGYKRTHLLGVEVQTNRLRVQITQSNATPLLQSLQALA